MCGWGFAEWEEPEYAQETELKPLRHFALPRPRPRLCTPAPDLPGFFFFRTPHSTFSVLPGQSCSSECKPPLICRDGRCECFQGQVINGTHCHVGSSALYFDRSGWKEEESEVGL